MQVSGRLLVLATFAIGIAMAAGAWWYNYRQSYRAAEFWGARDAALIVGSDRVELLRISFLPTDPADQTSALHRVESTVDLTGKPGLVHLRHALTYDANYDWDHRGQEQVGHRDWGFAVRFSQNGTSLNVLFAPDFTALGRLDKVSGLIEVLPCPRLGPAMLDYLKQPDVRAL
jgi:hypothetical protein